MTAEETKIHSAIIKSSLRKRFRCDRNRLILFGGYKRYNKIRWGASCLSAYCKQNVGSFNIYFIQGNFRAIIEGDSGGWSQSNDLISPLGALDRRIGSNATYCAKEVLCVH
ncbi:hypothetical protein CEXT_270461 [Caerostris extrusa]|uniref:Uncharacterized protein n=1 Tax=Caerostris extrusa TaxID=172846 RepID=A0AAV4XS14_CAEEX|nr:hypothetical protein CEXT_270461 [Caerostris extrusa]